MNYSILQGDVLDQLRTLAAESIQCVVTSPPYWGLRDYKCPGQLGLEPTMDHYIDAMVTVFREVRRVLRNDGTLWLNMGDSYDSGTKSNRSPGAAIRRDTGRNLGKGAFSDVGYWNNPNITQRVSTRVKNPHSKQSSKKSADFDGPNRSAIDPTDPEPRTRLKPKDLCGIPWRVAFALQSDGWWLRQDIIWSKPNPMPESVTDRPTRAHEYIFLMTKSARYYYDAAAIKEPSATNDLRRPYTSQGAWDLDGRPIEQRHGGEPRKSPDAARIEHQRENAGSAPTRERNGIRPRGHARPHQGFNETWDAMSKPEQQMYGRNKRSVWNIATAPYPEAHFATFPQKLVEPCILAGSRPGDTVLDPFCGSGTTLLVAIQHGRTSLGIELNPDYIAMAHKRIKTALPLLAVNSSLDSLLAPSVSSVQSVDKKGVSP